MPGRWQQRKLWPCVVLLGLNVEYHIQARSARRHTLLADDCFVEGAGANSI